MLNEIDVNIGFETNDGDQYITFDIVIDGNVVPHYSCWYALVMASTEYCHFSFEPFTCSCGVSGCAGIWDYVTMVVDDEVVSWGIPDDMGYHQSISGRFLRFDKKEFIAARKKILDFLEANANETYDEFGEPTLIQDVIDNLYEDTVLSELFDE